MNRKIIQITSTGIANHQGTQCDWILTALCDDGTVWTIDNSRDFWYQQPEIPQTE